MGIREFVNGTAGKAITVILIVIGVAAAAMMARASFSDPEIPGTSLTQIFVCAETGKSFSYTLSSGEKLPVPSPFSNKATGYLAERCFWTKDGKIKAEPTYVLVNDRIGKSGPTFCADCGRLVVSYNPVPTDGATPPPTATEYKKQRTQE